jgi:hypothetical protein
VKAAINAGEALNLDPELGAGSTDANFSMSLIPNPGDQLFLRCSAVRASGPPSLETNAITVNADLVLASSRLPSAEGDGDEARQPRRHAVGDPFYSDAGVGALIAGDFVSPMLDIYDLFRAASRRPLRAALGACMIIMKRSPGIWNLARRKEFHGIDAVFSLLALCWSCSSPPLCPARTSWCCVAGAQRRSRCSLPTPPQCCGES